MLDNETLFYYPATPVASLDDKDIVVTSTGDYFVGITNQKEYNEKVQVNISDIETNLEHYNKYLDAIVASTEFDDDTDPTHVVHFTNYNAYPPTPANPDRAEVVNKNDLGYVDTESTKRDAELNDKIEEQERRITALFNVKFDSGYFVYDTTTPETTLPTKGRLHIDLSNTTNEFVASVHGSSYDASWGFTNPEDEDEATTINNYLAANIGDNIITARNTFKLTSVEVVDDTLPIDERVYILKGDITQTLDSTITEGEFTNLRIVGEGEFDPATLDGVYVKVKGDTMTGSLTIDESENGPSSLNGAAGKEAKLILIGDRLNNNDAVGSIKFENAASNQVGYFTFRSDNTNDRANAYFLLNQSTRVTDTIDDSSHENTVVNKKYIDSRLLHDRNDATTNRYVKTKGGDSMEGPFKIKANPAISNSREARLIEVLNINSGTESSSLNLGAKTTRVYIGENKTTFVGEVHVQELHEKNNNEGIKIKHPVLFEGGLAAAIRPNNGDVRKIQFFKSRGANGDSEGNQELRIELVGSTYRNEFTIYAGSNQNNKVLG